MFLAARNKSSVCISTSATQNPVSHVGWTTVKHATSQPIQQSSSHPVFQQPVQVIQPPVQVIQSPVQQSFSQSVQQSSSQPVQQSSVSQSSSHQLASHPAASQFSNQYSHRTGGSSSACRSSPTCCPYSPDPGHIGNREPPP